MLGAIRSTFSQAGYQPYVSCLYGYWS